MPGLLLLSLIRSSVSKLQISSVISKPLIKLSWLSYFRKGEPIDRLHSFAKSCGTVLGLTTDSTVLLNGVPLFENTEILEVWTARRKSSFANVKYVSFVQRLGVF